MNRLNEEKTMTDDIYIHYTNQISLLSLDRFSFLLKHFLLNRIIYDICISVKCIVIYPEVIFFQSNQCL